MYKNMYLAYYTNSYYDQSTNGIMIKAIKLHEKNSFAERSTS